MQWSVHPPNAFLQSHLDQLLPGWRSPVQSILIVLQHSGQSLLQHTTATEAEKRRLRQRFILFGQQLISQLQSQDYQGELFDPRTGLPLLSAPGTLHLDDIAVVRSTLGYPTHLQGGCMTIKHPTWGSAVYPSILVSSAPPEVLEQSVIGLLAYHHSRSAADSLTV
jgi:Methylmalonic aciduria and homocystinuria type D protein